MPPLYPYQIGRWQPYDEHVPSIVKEEQLPPPRLGEHRFKISTLSNGRLLVMCFANNGTPEWWTVLPHPEGTQQ